MLNNVVFPSRKKLAAAMLYVTNRCNCQCKHCYIWAKHPKTYMPLEQIKHLLKSPAISANTLIGLEGGEFMLHPEAAEIMEYLYNHHPNFDLLSNGVNAEYLIALVKRYTPKRIYISLDGERETHDNIRGVNGLYDKVLYVIEELKEVLPISLMFTLTPFNTLEDLQHVVSVCKVHGIDMRIGIYSNMEYFQTQEPAEGNYNSLNYHAQDIPPAVKEFSENYDFMMLYTLYRKKRGETDMQQPSGQYCDLS